MKIVGNDLSRLEQPEPRLRGDAPPLPQVLRE